MNSTFVAISASSAIRGFDIRMMFAEAKILSVTDAAAAEDLRSEAYLDAQNLGFAEGMADLNAPASYVVPMMFEDEPALREAWLFGNHAGSWIPS